MILSSQVIFHHMFVSGMEDIANAISSFGSYSIEFEEKHRFCYLSLRFWKDDHLCKVVVTRFGRTVEFPKGHIAALSRVLSLVSGEPDLVSLSGCTSEVFELVDKCAIFKKGIHYPFRFDQLDLARLMHKESLSVFGRVDFFNVLEHLIVSLSGSLEQTWTLDTPELAKVIIILGFLVRVHCSSIMLSPLFLFIGNFETQSGYCVLSCGLSGIARKLERCLRVPFYKFPSSGGPRDQTSSAEHGVDDPQ